MANFDGLGKCWVQGDVTHEVSLPAAASTAVRQKTKNKKPEGHSWRMRNMASCSRARKVSPFKLHPYTLNSYAMLRTFFCLLRENSVLDISILLAHSPSSVTSDWCAVGRLLYKSWVSAADTYSTLWRQRGCWTVKSASGFSHPRSIGLQKLWLRYLWPNGRQCWAAKEIYCCILKELESLSRNLPAWMNNKNCSYSWKLSIFTLNYILHK